MSSQPKFILHHLEASRSLRVLWVLEYLQLPYELKVYPRDPQTRLAQSPQETLGKAHPLARSPTLTVYEEGQSEPITIAEAGAILNYLLENYANPSDPKPSDKTQKGQDLSFWLQFGESSLFLHLIPFFYGIRSGVTSEDASQPFDKASGRGLKGDLDYVEKVLGENGGTLLGTSDIGPVDICTEVSIEFIQLVLAGKPASYWSNLGVSIGPNTEKWIAKCKANDLYKLCTQKEVDASGKFTKGEEWLKPLYA